MKKNIIIGILSLFFLMQLGLNLYLLKRMEMPKIHILERPLKIVSNADNYSEYTILPEGTVLYDDSDSMNRRVKVYYNLQGIDFEFKDQDPEILKQPSEVRAIRSSELKDLLKDAPLTKKDIYLIIKHDEDINNTLRLALFKKYKIDPSEYEVN